MWSGTSTLGQSIITKVFEDKPEQFAVELEYARKLLIERAEAFKQEALKVGLKHYPYECGFFVTIPCQNPQNVFDMLKTKGLYVIPLKVGIRLTLSSITKNEVIRAVHILKECIE